MDISLRSEVTSSNVQSTQEMKLHFDEGTAIWDIPLQRIFEHVFGVEPGPDPAAEPDGRTTGESNGEANGESPARMNPHEIGPIPAVEIPERREASRRDFFLFLTAYFQHRFFSLFDDGQSDLAISIDRAVRINFSQELTDIPRGIGTTSFLMAGALFATLYGHKRRVLVVTRNDSDYPKDFIGNLVSELTTHEWLPGDFPEVCYPIQKLEGLPQRAGLQTSGGLHTDIKLEPKRIRFPIVRESEAMGCEISACGIFSPMKGRRPDLILVDRPFSTADRESPVMTAKIEQVLRNIRGNGRAPYLIVS